MVCQGNRLQEYRRQKKQAQYVNIGFGRVNTRG